MAILPLGVGGLLAFYLQPSAGPDTGSGFLRLPH